MRKLFFKFFFLLILFLSVGLGSYIYYSNQEQTSQKLFFSLIEQKQLKQIQTLLTRHPNYIVLRDISGKTPLHTAILTQDLELIQFLLLQHVDINAQIEGDHFEYIKHNQSSDDGYQNTPLHQAVTLGNKPITEALLFMKPALELRNFQDWTPLHLSVLHGHLDIARLLLLAGANPNAMGMFGKTPLYLAVEQKNTSLVQLLIKYKANSQLKDSNGLTSVQLAQKMDQDQPNNKTKEILNLLQV